MDSCEEISILFEPRLLDGDHMIGGSNPVSGNLWTHRQMGQEHALWLWYGVQVVWPQWTQSLIRQNLDLNKAQPTGTLQIRMGWPEMRVFANVSRVKHWVPNLRSQHT